MLSIHALCCGRIDAPRRIFYPDDETPARIVFPVPVFLFRHERGNVLFDTGIDCLAAADPPGRLGERVAAQFAIRSRADENVVDQLAKAGLQPDDITHVVNSHFHWDHCGCNALFRRAAFFVQRAEWEAARAGHVTYDPRQWAHALDYRLIDGEHDLFGDGSIVLLPTPGHTAGHQSLKVRAARDVELVFTADACYTQQHLEQGIAPAATSAQHPPALRDSLATLRALRHRQGCRLLFGHDAAQWATLRQVPDTLL